MSADFLDIPAVALDWHRAGRGAALATAVETWGSAPVPAGSQLAVSGRGEIAGSVSGGCVEGAVVTEALEALADGRPRLLSYGVADETAFSVGLACGGAIRVLVEPVGPEPPAFDVAMLAELVAARAARDPVGIMVDTETWARRLIRPEDAPDRFRSGLTGLTSDGKTFISIHDPYLRLFVVGAVHIAQALLPMARIAGFAPLLCDPRSSFAAGHRFPGELPGDTADATLREGFADEIFPEVGLDARTAVVTLSHDPKIDDPGLEAALASPAFYIGALGSRRTHAARLDRLAARGWGASDLARIHGPIGLDIGARGPAEIAVAILAEMVESQRKP